MTHSGAESTVRFYFRPLTPTQYHNEGFKHPLLRYCHDLNANVPVPVFFLFDLNSLLQLPDTQFSEQSLAGGGGNLLSGEDDFAALNFIQIYKTGYMEDVEQEKNTDMRKSSIPEHLILANRLNTSFAGIKLNVALY